MKRNKIVKRNSDTTYVVYQDEQSLEETHDMLIKALPGQSYVKEDLHRVSTTEVTGEALKKVSAGGKGGMASGSDARDAEKQVEVTSRVMVMSDPSQKAFDHNVALDKVVVGFGDEAEYLHAGEEYKYKMFVPSHLFGDNKNIKGFVEFTKRHGRDYNDYAHSNKLDASDHQRQNEFYLTGELLEESRRLYDEVCGYRGAWKYLGYNGTEHRRYRITVVNTLNQPEAKEKVDREEREKLQKKLGIKPSINYWIDEMSHARHHRDLYTVMNRYWRKDMTWEEVEKWLNDHNNDHAYYIMHFLENSKPEMWAPTQPIEGMIRVGAGDWRVETLGANKHIKARRVEMNPEYEAKRERIKELTSELYKDIKAVYRWEGTRTGKMKFFESKKAVQPEGWTCEDRKRKYKNKERYKNLR